MSIFANEGIRFRKPIAVNTLPPLLLLAHDFFSFVIMFSMLCFIVAIDLVMISNLMFVFALYFH